MTALLEDLVPDVTSFLSGPLGHVIDGVEQPSRSGEEMSVIDPATGGEVARVASGGAAEVNLAVAAARQAFDDGRWTQLPPGEKELRLHRLADLVERDLELLAQLDVVDNGMPLTLARAFVAHAIGVVRYYAGWPTKIEGRVNPTSSSVLSYTTREPIGVCAGITPWNGPLVMAIAKVAPALACGNTSVLKPAEQTPLSAIYFGRLCLEAGIPDGVVNVIQGTGASVGQALVVHPDVDKVAFTGSTDVGRHIQAAAGPTLKRLSMELGGKSPNIVLGDADLPAAAAGAMAAVWMNSGQVCYAGTRLLVDRSVHDSFVNTLVEMTEQIVVGPGMSPDTQMGPLVSQTQFDRVTDYISVGQSEGAELASGGTHLDGGGYFVRPTIFANVSNGMRIAQEEIFGPVLSVVPFDDPAEAVRLANETQYGLGAAVWTQNVFTAHQVAEQIRSGVVWVNTYGELENSVPFGGFKQSGYGKEQGSASIDTYTQHKSVVIKVKP